VVGRIQDCPHDLGEDEEEEGVQDRQVRRRRTLLQQREIVGSNPDKSMTHFLTFFAKKIEEIKDLCYDFLNIFAEFFCSNYC
jgi:hypothetical protein